MPSDDTRRRRQLLIGVGLPLALVMVVILIAVGYLSMSGDGGEVGPAPGLSADPTDARQVAQGRAVYGEQCAVCHGADLQGETEDWRTRLPHGALPAPPHDETGHTWHHPDQQLFLMIKHGLGPFAPEGYVSDMPAFDTVLSDEEIAAVLAYIKSTWPQQTRDIQAQRTAAAARAAAEGR